MVTEQVADDFRKLIFCQDCKESKEGKSRFVIQEFRTNTRGKT